MRLRYSFRFQQIGDTWLGTAVGQNAHLFNGVLQLNEVGHFIVSELAKLSPAESGELESAEYAELTEKESVNLLAQRLMAEYEVDAVTAQNAIMDVVDYLSKEGVLE